MRITSREFLKVENFEPYKYIEIYRDGKKILTIRTRDTTATFEDLKEKFRISHKLRTQPSMEFHFVDGRGRCWAVYDSNITNRQSGYYAQALNYLNTLRQKHKHISIFKFIQKKSKAEA